ncbi:hypothetical protein [Marinimicrobium alkaliphilum]|uniref:hypothetical protein n=1 Tax=Marinimicrobium alkaliphilum TaxID=2202654 RepID=UPI000DB91256|nr:hypothetical protein [Marinimicrobium alkaliphilum]
MLSKTAFILVIMLNLTFISSEVAGSEEQYIYRADFVSISDVFIVAGSQLVFDGGEVYLSESSVIDEFKGCRTDGGYLEVVSSLMWLGFKVDIHSDPVEFSDADWGDLVLNEDSELFGEKIKVLGIKRETKSFTLVYYSPLKGILGVAFMTGDKNLFGDYNQPVYWVEGEFGICGRGDIESE